MAGPVPTYLTTQTAAQTAFTVPFGLLTFVNAAIATAVTAGEFNVTVDCSLFVTEDVSNLRIYLDSLGYNVNFAKDTNNKSLNIDWGRFLSETVVTVFQGTVPWIVSGTVTADQGAPNTLANGWPVKLTDGSNVLGTPANPLVVTSDGIAGTDVNEYGEDLAVLASTLTPIITYVVPGGNTLKVTGVVGWGTYDGEFVVQVNGVTKGGGWSSPADRTLQIDYAAGTIPAVAGDTVTVNVIHYSSTTQTFKANLLGALQ